MANSWNGPQLGSPIRTDVPELQKKLIALLKGDPTSVADIPSGAKRLVNTSGTQWQVQQYNGSSWAAIGKLMHDVDKLDGYHAAITPAANTVAVRNADKKLEGDITGNAATASSATTLSETLPVNKGGTGATTSEAARSNLGVPPTSHASTNTTHGVGNATQYGHLKLSDATNSSSGVSGGVAATPAAVKVAKDAADAAMTKASTLATTSTPGIVKPGTGMTVDSTGSLDVDDTVVRTTGNQTVAGAKTFTYSLYSKSDTLIRTQIDNISISDTSREASTVIKLAVVEDKDKKRFGSLEVIANTDGSRSISLVMRNRADTGWLIGIRAKELVDGTSICEAPTPGENSNTNHIATTRWVRNYTIPTGTLIPSLATSMTGYLLCNGAAVSRTTYANLFSIIGTKFGAGDGSTTFNLPDFRNKTLWGANGNLMSAIAAGLPNAEGSVTAMADRTRWVSFRSFSGAIQAAGSENPAVSDEYYTHYIGGYNGFTVNLSKSNSIYGNSTTVQPPAIAVNIFIKY